MPNFISRAQQAVTEELQEFSNGGPFGGVQSEVPLDTIEQFGMVDVLNMVLRQSVAETRPGYTILHAYPAPANEDTVGIADFYTSAAARVQTVMTLTRFLKWDATAQDWVVITGALTGGTQNLFTWTVVNQKLCFCQGVDPIELWDGITSSFGPAAPGVIIGTTLGAGGAGYIAGDSGTITTGNGLATYVVLTVSVGAVATFAITNPGLNYAIGAGIPTVATSGSGTGFTINITSIVTASYPAKYLMELDTHLIAAYTIEGGTPHTQRVRWSGAGNPTDWTSPGAGVNDILGDLGPITGCVKIFQSGYIFHQWGITQMIPTGIGTAPFQFVPLTTRARGNTIPYSLAPSGEEFVCYVGKDNVYKFNGTNSESIGDRPIQNNKRFGARKRIFADLTAVNQNIVFGYVSDMVNGQPFPAYWLVIPGVAVWIYNLDEYTWLRFTFTDILSLVGRFFRGGTIRWLDLIGTWAQQGWTWASLAAVNPYDSVLLAFNDGVDGNFDFTRVCEQPWLMSGVFVMGDPRHAKTIQKFRITILDDGPVTFTVTLANQAGLVVSQTVTMGTNSGNDISQVLTMSITGIRINWSISGTAEQDVTIVEFAPMYNTAGEQRGGSVDN